MRKCLKNKYFWINIMCIIALAGIISPLLYLAQYNFPMADDWSYGLEVNRVILNGGNVWDYFGAIIYTVGTYYTTWEARYSNGLLSALTPGVWGELFYFITTWIMLAGIILSQLYLVKAVFGLNKTKIKYLIPIVIPFLCLEILYLPYVEESLYWWVGAVNYTFIQALSYVLIALIWKLKSYDVKTKSYWCYSLIVGLLAVLVGGNNFSTSLSTILISLCILVAFTIWDKKSVKRIWWVPVLLIGCLLICVCSPAIDIRLNANYGGKTSGNVIEAIFTSLWVSMLNIYSWASWMNIKLILVILFTLPFIWKALKTIEWHFPLPGIFTVLTFGIYASQTTPNFYVDGLVGPPRACATFFYSYIVWIMINVCYWVGWFQKKKYLKNVFNRLSETKKPIHLLFFCSIVGLLLGGCVFLTNKEQTTSYKAFLSIQNGTAAQYGKEWEERLAILKNPNVTQVEFEPLTYEVELLCYSDLDIEWIANVCALYYGKEYVRLTNDENLE